MGASLSLPKIAFAADLLLYLNYGFQVTGVAALQTLFIPATVVSIQINIAATSRAALSKKPASHFIPPRRVELSPKALSTNRLE